MMILGVCVAFFLCGVSAVQVININNGTDKSLHVVNKFLTTQGLGLFHFEAMADDKVQMGPGVQIGLNTLERRGDCILEDIENGTCHLHFRVGFRLFMLGYGDITINGDHMAGLFKVNKNELQLSYSVHNKTNCHVVVDKYELSYLDDAVFFSSNPKYDGMNVSDLFREYGRSKINENMLRQRAIIEHHLNRDICNSHESDVDKTGFAAIYMSATAKK